MNKYISSIRTNTGQALSKVKTKLKQFYSSVRSFFALLILKFRSNRKSSILILLLLILLCCCCSSGITWRYLLNSRISDCNFESPLKGGVFQNFIEINGYVFECVDGNCSIDESALKSSNISDGEYDAKLFIKTSFPSNTFEVAQCKYIVDTVLPTLKVEAPKFTNKSEEIIKIRTELSNVLSVNGSEEFIADEEVEIYTVPISKETPNEFTIISRDSANNQVEEKITITFDDKNFIELLTPQNDEAVNSNYLLAGNTDPNSTVVVNGNSTTANEFGYFEINLEFGDGNINITSTDIVGNVATHELRVQLYVAPVYVPNAGSPGLSYAYDERCNEAKVKAYSGAETFVEVSTTMQPYYSAIYGEGNCRVQISNWVDEYGEQSCSITGWVSGDNRAFIISYGVYLATSTDFGCGASIL